jgi:hypothetical protein
MDEVAMKIVLDGVGGTGDGSLGFGRRGELLVPGGPGDSWRREDGLRGVKIADLSVGSSLRPGVGSGGGYGDIETDVTEAV